MEDGIDNKLPQDIVSSSSEESSQPVSQISTFRRIRSAMLFFLIPSSLYVILPLVAKIPDVVMHTLLTFTVVTAVHLLDRWVLFKDTKETLDKLKEGIKFDIANQMKSLVQVSSTQTKQSLSEIKKGVQSGIVEQTASLVQSSASLEAMSQSGIVRVYSTRTQACEDIRKDLVSPENTFIRIIGISLNDFIRRDQRPLYEAWRVLGLYIRGKLPVKSKLDIKVLLIDPRCRGAVLRSKAEVRGLDVVVGRLADDVNAIVPSLVKLETEAKALQEKTGVSFECRLYRLPPILFLCLVDSVFYTQQYHFWSARNDSTPIPVLKYWKHSEMNDAYLMHTEMTEHFNWIWDNASISVSDYYEKSAIGIDNSLSQCGAVNVYTDHKEAYKRIKWLLENAKQKVSIQGVSLHSFFKTGELFKAIYKLVEGRKIDIEVLLLDPDCNQAKYRSYRERLFVTPEQSFEQYKGTSEQHIESDLYKDTQSSIKSINNMVSDLLRIRKDSQEKLRLVVRLYDTAPSCFILRVDNTVLVEQYHYGKFIPEEDQGHVPVILGKDMPIIEYSDSPPPVNDDNEDGQLGNPYKLLEDHFSFVFRQAKQIFPEIDSVDELSVSESRLK